MKRPLSLKWLLSLTFLTLGLLLVVGYSVLSAYYFTRGMDNIVMANMAQSAHSYLELMSPAQRANLERFSGYYMAHDWAQMPDDVRRAFGQAPSQPDTLYKRDESSWLRPPDTLYFALRLASVDGPIFIVSRMDHEMVIDNNVAGRDAIQRLLALFAIAGSIALLLVGVWWWLLRHVSRPINALAQWARSLDSSTLAAPAPDFIYPELNEMARLVRSSLSSAQQGLAREQRFLAYASHELRTPISVVGNNLELLRKLQETQGCTLAPRQRQAIERMERASQSMQHLTETLLWLSRERQDALPSRELDLEALIAQLIEEMRYLLADKPVEVEVITETCLAVLPEAPARIVLGNLIRNAFLHTREGQVCIRQQGRQVWIDNRQYGLLDSVTYASAEGLGFGLGLKLTAQLTEKLGWACINQPGPAGHAVFVVLGRVDPHGGDAHDPA
nr:HAMP domain-containing sensor histidine kinase [Halomonas socia]